MRAGVICWRIRNEEHLPTRLRQVGNKSLLLARHNHTKPALGLTAIFIRKNGSVHINARPNSTRAGASSVTFSARWFQHALFLSNLPLPLRSDSAPQG